MGCGFSLITAMKLDKQNPKDKALYNDILVSSADNGRITLLTFSDDPGFCPCARNRRWH